MNEKYCVILAGGAGTRLWPISRLDFPKQFLEIENSGGKTFIQATYERFCKIVPPENIIVVSVERYRDLVKEQLPLLPDENLLLEPYARSTAPAIAYAAYTLFKRNPNASMVVTPCDHLIKDVAPYRADILSALEFASKNDVLVTIGVTPTRPDPNFGYIQVVGGPNAFHGGDPLPVKTFTEKPDLAIAKLFVDSGEFLWNSGVFAWKASVIIEELEKYMPQQSGWFDGWKEAVGTSAEKDFLAKAYGGCEKAAIDTGVMEKTSKAWVYPADFDWSDIGAWPALFDHLPKDENGNTVSSNGQLTFDANRNLVISTDKKKIIAIDGLSDFMVIETADALLICPKGGGKYQAIVSNLAMPKYEKYR